MYLEVAAEIARICRAIGIPVVVGGSYFNEPTIARTWLDIPGISVVVAAEAERIIPTIVAALATGQNVPALPGIWTPATGVRQVAPPLQDLDSLPFADYSDFPWHLYPRRIIPMMAGRGCGWGVCTFCSDVSTVAGRTYRSRSPANVLDEIEHQGRKHDADLFVMLDLKLNSDLEVWRALLDRMPHRRPGARWTASVHIGRGENGLSLDELRAARAAGLVRVTTGLESGSQHVLNSMAKGTDLERTSRFLKDAHKAGLSVRTTMIIGYPGETAADIRKTAEFLALHEPYLERVMVNRFSIQPGTAAAQRIEHSPRKFGALTVGRLDTRNALLPHRNSATKESGYFRSVWRVLSAANRINRKPLRADAQLLEGVM
ncbi:radical SAM protein [Siccirubricoccus sp. G192]|uniref:B12-binding domain-containing radical SAM protein n=1 Tax=Siccirubricoccus sp. G192 TaxID=2849651 RepID=UPI001C2BEB90|nr:radical SAM protein [Siccirubricoccus sp. G192]MBV1799312.1 B12-binding domain-containing radical SAM protein [Siccirubricoccus sp. G192]